MDAKPTPSLTSLCIESASANRETVEVWRRQHRTLDLLPAPLADALLRRLLERRLVFPSLLEGFRNCVEEVDLRGEAVDAEWLAYLGGFKYLRSLNLADCKGVNDSAIWPLAGMTSFKKLDLSRCSKVTDTGIRHLLCNSNLEKLCISKTGVSGKGVELLNSLRNLQILDIGGITITDKEFCSLECLTELAYLDIGGSDVSDGGARVLNNFPRLSFLNIEWTYITNLPFLPSLKYLNMSNCEIKTIFYGSGGLKPPLLNFVVRGSNFVDIEEAFSNMELSYITYLDMSSTPCSNYHILEEMKGLEYLDLSFGKMTDDFMRCVEAVGGNLRYLNLSNTRITSLGLAELVGVVMNIETLLLSHTAIDDLGLAYISLMPSLTVIDLSKTRIQGISYSGGNTMEKVFSLDMLHNINQLESLNLEETALSDEVVCRLVALSQLKSLYLNSDCLSEISLCVLSSLTKLNHLGFKGAFLTNSGLLAFRPPPLLCLLDLQGCWLLSPETVSAFCMKYPAIEVKHEYLKERPPKLSVGSSSSEKTVQASPYGQQERLKKATQFPNRTNEIVFVDERIKYSRKELLELQFRPTSDLAPCDIPEQLRKE